MQLPLRLPVGRGNRKGCPYFVKRWQDFIFVNLYWFGIAYL